MTQPQSVGLLWTSDQPVAETSIWQTHNTHNRQASMPPAGFEPAIPAGEPMQTHALDRSATGIGKYRYLLRHCWCAWNWRLYFEARSCSSERSLLSSSRLSVRPHVSARLPFCGGISCRGIPRNYVEKIKIWLKSGTLHEVLSTFYCCRRKAPFWSDVISRY